MDNSKVKDNIESIFESFKDMIKVETVVGEAVQMGDATLVPFVNVTFGFGTGAYGKNDDKILNRSGGAGGARLEPTAVLVIKGDRVELLPLNGSFKLNAFERLIGMVPEIITKMKKDKYIYLNDEADDHIAE